MTICRCPTTVQRSLLTQLLGEHPQPGGAFSDVEGFGQVEGNDDLAGCAMAARGIVARDIGVSATQNDIAVPVRGEEELVLVVAHQVMGDVAVGRRAASGSQAEQVGDGAVLGDGGGTGRRGVLAQPVQEGC